MSAWLKHPWTLPIAAIAGIGCAYLWLQSTIGDAAFAVLVLLLLAAGAALSKLARIRAGRTAIEPTTADWRTGFLSVTSIHTTDDGDTSRRADRVE